MATGPSVYPTDAGKRGLCAHLPLGAVESVFPDEIRMREYIYKTSSSYLIVITCEGIQNVMTETTSGL